METSSECATDCNPGRGFYANGARVEHNLDGFMDFWNVVCGSTQKKANSSIDDEYKSKADAAYLSAPAMFRSLSVLPRPRANSDKEGEGRGPSEEGRSPTEVVKKSGMADEHL